MNAIEMADRLSSHIHTQVPGQPQERASDKLYESVLFPMSENSDYDFGVDCYGGGESNHCAELRNSQMNNSNSYFWYIPFEIYGKVTAENLFNQLIQYTIRVLTQPTRIIHRKGLILGHFVLEADHAGEWERVYSCGYLRWTVSSPKIKDKEHIYTANPR